MEDGTGPGGDPPPVNDPAYYSADASDARYVQQHASGANVRFREGKYLELFNYTDNKWYPATLQNVDGNPVLNFDAGVTP